MSDLDTLVENYFAPKKKTLTKQILYEIFDEIMREQESKKALSTERQERLFVEIVNSYASIENPTTLSFTNDIKIQNVVGAEKVEGLAAYGKEPYTDVIIKTTSKDINVSMKGLIAPSVIGAGASGIEKLIPGWLKTITPKVVDRLIEIGYEKGDWITRSQKNIKSVSRKIIKKYGDTAVYTGYEDGKEYPVVPEDDARFQGYPTYIGKLTIMKEDGVNKIKSNVDDSEAKALPDMFFKLGEENIRVLFSGTEEMGGPVEYIYKGPMDVEHVWDEEKNDLSFVRANLYDIDNFVKSFPNIFLRVRKRRIDQPFDPDLSHPILGKAIFGRGVITREYPARIVIADKLSSKAEFGGEI